VSLISEAQYEAAQSIGVKRFSTVSGLAQHIESGVCRGGKAGLGKAVQYIETRLKEMGMVVKLLM
jgi:hypothetical protein